jgi:UDP-N-acetylglucosamine acyltransferase
MNQIHPTVLIDSHVQLGENIKIHPYSLIEGQIEIGDGVEIGPFVHISGWAKIGKNTKIYSGASIGNPPQDYSFDGQKGLIEIGENCCVREGATIHTPVHGDKGEKTIVGNNVLMMVNSHVAHNCIVGNNAIMVNGSLLGGYAILEESAILSGNVAVHQLCRVGAYSMVGGLGKVVQDIPPFMMADGVPAVVHGLNVVGLRRNGFTQADRSVIKDVYKTIYSGFLLKESLKQLEEKYKNNANVERMINFIRNSKRGIVSGGRLAE